MKKIRYISGGWNKLKPLITRKRLMLAGLITFVLLLIIPLVTYAHFARDIKDRERLMNRNNTGFVLLDRNREVIYSFGRINHDNNIRLNEISDDLEQALIASEDKEFYKHDGYSPRGIARALYSNIKNMDLTLYGGSTITQQLVKNNLLTSERTFLRKYQEFSMAMAVERRYSKQEIIEMYLNSVYFGEGAFGIGAAAKTYFNKSAQDLTLAESSMLIGLLPAPSAYSPVSGDKEKAKERQQFVLDHMVDAGFVTREKAETAYDAKVAYQKQGRTKQKHAQHFVMMVLEDLNRTYGEETILRAGFSVTTTLDLNWQRQAEKHVRERVAELSPLGGTNAGLVAIDPKNGEVRALVGSVNWDNPKFGKVNVTLMPRQPGSSFKPIYYTESLNKKLITPATILEDEPKTFGGTYRPQNYDFRFRGDIPVRRALALSLNIPAIEVMQKLGVREASETAQRMGISTVTEPDKYGLSLALGTAEVKLLDITNAYAAFANQGQQSSTNNIKNIKDKFDRDIYSYSPKTRKVMSGEASFLISSILSDQEARAPTFGQSLVLSGRTAAVKTGTTDKNRDAWTVGYTPSLAVGVWVGNNQNKPMFGVAGSNGAAPIWRRSMETFLADSPVESFKPPKNVVEKKVCSNNALPTDRAFGGVYKEYFIKGAEPAENCEVRRQEFKKDNKEEKKEPEKKDEEKDEEDKDDRETGGRGGGGDDESPNESPETPPPADDSGNSGSGSDDPPAEEPPAEEPPPVEEPAQPTSEQTGG